MFENFEEVLSRKFVTKFSLNFGNNLGEKGFENFKEICMYSEIWRKFFLYFGNNLRKYVIGNFEAVLSKCQENYKTNNFEKNLGLIFNTFRE